MVMKDMPLVDNAPLQDKVVQQVIDKFKSRSEVGYKKYGQTLSREDLSLQDWLTHLQEELMDAVNYIEAIKSQTK